MGGGIGIFNMLGTQLGQLMCPTGSEPAHFQLKIICLTTIAIVVLVLVMRMTRQRLGVAGYSEQQAGIAAGVTIFTGLVTKLFHLFSLIPC